VANEAFLQVLSGLLSVHSPMSHGGMDVCGLNFRDRDNTGGLWSWMLETHTMRCEATLIRTETFYGLRRSSSGHVPAPTQKSQEGMSAL
jgi:hypothetical protein